jgi:glycerol-3-phosphate acyltransferase PlsY
MELLITISLALGAYLTGAIPSAVWLGKSFFGIDVREHGSGNAGATNTFRVLGKKAGIIVMAADILKGAVATSYANLLINWSVVDQDDIVFYKLMFGVIAVIGHIFPVYVNFKGGKGVATLLGMVLAIHAEAALICIAVFLVVFLISKYVSLGSMIAALAFPILLLLPRFSPDEPVLTVFGFVIFVLVVLTHQKNIKRLINGEESKMVIRLRRPRN